MVYHDTGQVCVAYFIPDLHNEVSVERIWVFKFTLQYLI